MKELKSTREDVQRHIERLMDRIDDAIGGVGLASGRSISDCMDEIAACNKLLEAGGYVTATVEPKRELHEFRGYIGQERRAFNRIT